MGRLLPQKPPRRYPSGFCNLLDTDRDRRRLIRPAPDLRVPSGPVCAPGARVDVKDGFSPLLLIAQKQNTACTCCLLRKGGGILGRTTAAFSR